MNIRWHLKRLLAFVRAALRGVDALRLDREAYEDEYPDIYPGEEYHG